MFVSQTKFESNGFTIRIKNTISCFPVNLISKQKRMIFIQVNVFPNESIMYANSTFSIS